MATSKTTRLRVRIAEVEVEVNGRTGRIQSMAFEGTFESGAVEVLGDLMRLFAVDRRELEEQREHVTALQAAGTTLVERNRELVRQKNDVAAGVPAMVDEAFKKGQAHERQALRGGVTKATKKKPRGTA